MRRNEYEFGTQLGKGSFGTVFKIRRKSDRRTLVCKQIQLQGMSDKARDEANHEVKLLKKVSSGSRYIVQYEDSFVEGKELFIIMEFCEHGDLSQYLKARRPQHVEEKTVWKFLIQIGVGLHWLHSQRILHRDIKTLNVFLTSSDDVRLGDLGVARVLSHNSSFAKTFVGTPYYLSPELCEEKPYNEKSDVWAYGCVVYELCALKHPFEARNHAALLIKIIKGMYAPVSDRYSAELRALIDECMCRKVELRPTVSALFAGCAVRAWAQELGLAGSPLLGDASEAAEPRRRATPQAQKSASRPKPTAVPAKASVRAPKPASPASRLRPAEPRAELRLEPRVEPKAVPRMLRRAPAAGPRLRRDGGPRRTEAAPKAQIICAPASSSAAPLVIRNAPARGGAPMRQAARSGDVPHSQGLRRERSSKDPAEERRRAAREVAELPDVISLDGGRRNVISVQELQEGKLRPQEFVVEPVAIDSPAVQSGKDATSTSSHEGSSLDVVTLSPRAVLAQAVHDTEKEQVASESLDDATILPVARPANAYPALPPRPPRLPDPPRPQLHEEPGQIEAGADEEADAEGDDSLIYNDDASGEPDDLQASSGRFAEVTECSVFVGSLGQSSLAYTNDDACLTGMSSLSTSAPCPRDDASFCGSVDALGPDIVVRWDVPAGADESHDGPGAPDEDRNVTVELSGLQLTGRLDSRGLLCDRHWGCGRAPERDRADIADDEACDPTLRPASSEAIEAASPNKAEAAAVCDPVLPSLTCPSAIPHERLRPVTPETNPPPVPSPVAAAGPQDRHLVKCERELRRLNHQIKRLTADVVKGLDVSARNVWYELYDLFKAKMATDEMTDKDQFELEAFIFDQLPTESTDMILNVYRVLTLEQERDQCQRELDSC